MRGCAGIFDPGPTTKLHTRNITHRTGELFHAQASFLGIRRQFVQGTEFILFAKRALDTAAKLATNDGIINRLADVQRGVLLHDTSLSRLRSDCIPASRKMTSLGSTRPFTAGLAIYFNNFLFHQPASNVMLIVATQALSAPFAFLLASRASKLWVKRRP